MNEIVPFIYEDTPIRTLLVDGEPWFVLTDLCKVLDLSNVTRTAERLDPVALSQAQVQNERGQMRSTVVVSEAGMYEVIIRSDKSEAVTFRRWITTEVLPAIRKTGSYSTTPALTEDQIVQQALQITSARVEALTTRLAIVEPKARAFDLWLGSNVHYGVGTVAQALAGAGAEIGRQRLFAVMEQQGWIYRHQQQWHPYQTQIETKRLTVRLGDQLNTRTGERFATVTVRITAKGAVRLAVVLGVAPEVVAELLAANDEAEVAA